MQTGTIRNSESIILHLFLTNKYASQMINRRLEHREMVYFIRQVVLQQRQAIILHRLINNIKLICRSKFDMFRHSFLMTAKQNSKLPVKYLSRTSKSCACRNQMPYSIDLNTKNYERILSNKRI